MIKAGRVKKIFIPGLILLLFTAGCLFKDEEFYFRRADSYFEQGQVEKVKGIGAEEITDG